MINIENLSFGYRKNQLLFQDLDLEMKAGNIYGLLGKNGAGKSSLLKIVTGLLFPDSGKVDVEGFTPKDRYPQFLREVYLVSEEFYLPSLKVRRFVEMYSPFYPRFNHEVFNRFLDEFNIPVNQELSGMSYGQKKIFLLSFGVATDCKLLLLDEPTNGLDIPSKSKFRKIVANAVHEDRTIIISTHQVRDMENLIDPIVILDQGKVVFFQDYQKISTRLSFMRMAELPDESKRVYAESSLGGYTVVKINEDGEETNVNLEHLFNAVISNTGKIKEIFNKA
jgi:ABC-2 type transport system ATP-binding protein